MIKKIPLLSPGLFRSSHWKCSVKQRVLKKCAYFTRKHVSESFFRKFAGLQPCSYIKKRLQHWCFPVKFAKSLRTSTVKNIFERLLLFVSPQNTTAKSSGEFELYKTLSIRSIFLNITILFDQMLS